MKTPREGHPIGVDSMGGEVYEDDLDPKPSEDDPEDRAIDALIVLALRGEPFDDDIDVDPSNLPELSNEELAALEAIDIKEIIRKAKAT